jgi:hypothetical protein
MEAEVREILRNALKEKKDPWRGFGTESAALFSGQGVFIDEPIPEWRGQAVEPIEFK